MSRSAPLWSPTASRSWLGDRCTAEGSAATPFSMSLKYGHAPAAAAAAAWHGIAQHSIACKTRGSCVPTLTLHWPAEEAGPVCPLDVLQLRPRGEVLAVLRLEVEVLVVSRVGLYVHAVLAVVEALHVAVVSVAGALQAEGLSVVDVDLVVHGSQGEALAVRAELHVGQPVPGVTAETESKRKLGTDQTDNRSSLQGIAYCNDSTTTTTTTNNIMPAY